jgi:hypothetical protein
MLFCVMGVVCVTELGIIRQSLPVSFFEKRDNVLACVFLVGIDVVCLVVNVGLLGGARL